ncbi:hypothetical protein [Bacillus thermotolerans]|uniref:Antitoxin VbhA domain-containing protein n=1 Tax=Bacillus thermotolerans TaxID=1221996 RepID=A0A0F5HNQ7_BACTR|nr:hypothetical protein [Bacillus thermotolerans]KKB34660.1 hypothetical protein QY97_02210 [Bacillus thermotolerans]KKB38566.1 hypothetical protein QY95_02564 [Bacillus thermotolerans]
MSKKYRTLDEARRAYLNGKITALEFSSLMKKNTIADNERKQIQKKSKKIERKLATV